VHPQENVSVDARIGRIFQARDVSETRKKNALKIARNLYGMGNNLVGSDFPIPEMGREGEKT
ncbi:MAG: hypothetical protein WC341_14275, partial [Bacteroidales bacterium]